ncbi:MAG: hypothetical protein HQK60_04540 [Deltaproteobacteria bacterium]|nr:hypothetical protein [Deltaproteobacteria bacterium]
MYKITRNSRLLGIMAAVVFIALVTTGPVLAGQESQSRWSTPVPSPCTVSVSPNQDIMVPYIILDGQTYWGCFTLDTSDRGEILLKTIDFGENLNPLGSCPPATLSSILIFTIPDIVFNNVSHHAVFKYYSTNDDELWFILSRAVPNSIPADMVGQR